MSNGNIGTPDSKIITDQSLDSSINEEQQLLHQDTENPKINPKERFIFLASIMQMCFVIADNLAGTFAVLYAVTRGSVGLMQGVIVSVRELGTAILQPIWGYFSDRRGRRGFVFTGLMFQALSWGILLPLTTSPMQILLVFIVQTTLGTMFIPTWNAWIGDRTVKRNRGSTLGYLGLLGSVAGSIALLIVSIYMQAIDPNRDFISTFLIAFRIAGAFYLLAAAVSLIIPEHKRNNGTNAKRTKSGRKNPIKRVTARIRGIFYSYKPEFRRILVIDGFFRIAWSAAWPLFPYATLSATDGWIEIAVLSLAISITMGFSQFYGGRLSDRIGRKQVILWTRLALILPPLLFSLGVYYNNPIFLLISNALVGFTLGAGIIAMSSLILDIAPEDKQATYFSTYMTVMGILSFIGSLLMGFVLFIIIPSSAPSTNTIIALLVAVSGFRLIAWWGYRYLPNQ